MREHVLVPAARRTFDGLSADDQRRFDEIFDLLCHDPSLAQPVRTLTDAITPTIYRYQDGEDSVVFDLPDDATVRVWMMGRGPGRRTSR